HLSGAATPLAHLTLADRGGRAGVVGMLASLAGAARAALWQGNRVDAVPHQARWQTSLQEASRWIARAVSATPRRMAMAAVVTSVVAVGVAAAAQPASAAWPAQT